MKKENNLKGKNAELRVIDYLKKLKYKILFHHYLFLPYGEIDIIVIKNNVISFVEVKYRKNNFLIASELVNFRKQKKIIKTAELIKWKEKWHEQDYIFIFDVAIVDDTNITYIQNAFIKKEEQF